jgi:hypothetical protein
VTGVQTCALPIFTTEREETTLYDGREWRIHYWLFRKEKIRELMGSGPAGDPDVVADESILYGGLPDNIWHRKE